MASKTAVGALAALSMTALALAGCTSGQEGAEAPEPTDSQSGSIRPVDATGVELPEARWWIESPVELPYAPHLDAIEAAWAAADDGLAAQWARHHDQVDQSVAACMAEAGFDFQPRPYHPPEDQTREDSPYQNWTVLPIQWLPATIEEAERVGYGVESDPRAEDGHDLVGPEDPNAAYVESLSDSGRAAYEKALNGTDPETGKTVNPDNCFSKAWEEYPDPAGPDMSFLEPAGGMDSLHQGVVINFETGPEIDPSDPDAIAADPEMVALRDEYERCALASEIGQHLLPGWMDTHVLVSLAKSTASDGSVLDLPPGPFDPDDVPPEQLALVGSQAERDVAVVDFQCREETDYVNRYAQIVADAEAKYIAEHEAEIDKMMAQIEQFLAERKKG
ncbi:MAG: hypothetical protein LBK95_05525 [Bifidobacteriaceae bacterium]|jgi:hypothetical protein|nr:hypothetical protein [Bifidobacteriaceae bacterium]